MKKLFFVFIILINAQICFASTPTVPTFIQEFLGSDNASGASYVTYVLNGPHATQAGDTLICAGQYSVNASITSVTLTDNKGSTYTQAVTGTAGDTNQTVRIFTSKNIVAGITTITVTYNGSTATFNNWHCAEFGGIDNTTPVDKASCAFATSGAPASGSQTPTQTGDMIYEYFEQDSSGTKSTGINAGSQSNITWQLIGAFLGNPSGVNTTQEGVQWGIYNSVAAINPTAAVTPTTNQWNACSVFLKPATAGNTPITTVRVDCDQHLNAVSITASSTWAFPCNSGDNLLVFVHICPSTTANAVSDTNSNTWVQVGTDLSFGGSGHLDTFYAKNAIITSNMVATVTESGAATDCDFRFYALANASANPLDTTTTAGTNTACSAGLCKSSGTDVTANNANLSTTQITPGATNEVCINAIGVNNPQVRGAATGFQANIVYSPQEASIAELDENNGAGIYLNGASLAAFTFGYSTASTAGVGAWASTVACFLTPLSGGGGGQLFVIHP